MCELHRSFVLLFALFFVFHIIQCSSEENNVNIGLIFEETNPDIEKVFYKAIEDVNAKGIEPQFSGISFNISYGNAFQTSTGLCEALQSNLTAVFGPLSSLPALHTMSICDNKEMPYIDTRLDFSVKLSTINLHPHPSQIAIILKELIIDLDWNGFTILYESAEYLPLVSEILEMYGSQGPVITLRRYDLNLNGNYRSTLRRVKKSSDNSFVVVGSTDTLPELLKQAQQIGLMTENYRYLIGNLDFQTIDLKPYQYCDANITSLRLISPNDKRVVDILKSMVEPDEDPFRNLSCPLSVHSALVYDGILMLEETFKHITFNPTPLSCDDHSSWDKGYTLVNYLKSISINGLSGDIHFDYQGLRTDFNMEIVELTTSGLVQIGDWNSRQGLNTHRKMSPISIDADMKSLMNKSFIVLTALSAPYGMLKKSPEKLTGNDQYEGFGIDLIQELSKRLGFNYTFRLQEDNAYGTLNQKTGEWNGMIREILEDRADLAITDLTMTSARETAVDFTIPFMNLGIAILYKKPTKEPPKLFSFMSPFSGEVWLFLGVGYLGVSLCLFILGRLSPAEWDNPYPCVQEPTQLENQFSFSNCLWFTMGALLQQGSELAPKAPSTRTVASIWWFFTLIMVSSYTANLAAFLTIESLSTPIESAEDLANGKGQVKYGAKKDGSTIDFFKNAQYPTYKKMYDYMQEHPELLPTTNVEGVERVEKENYAFLMESTSIEYNVERKCNLTQVGSLLDEKGYGIAMRKNWQYRDALSQAILQLQEQGVLTKMKTKWWKEKHGGGACSHDGDQDQAEELGMANLGGVYFVLLVGSTLGSCYGILEWLLNIYKTALHSKVPFKEELIEEIKFIIRCSGNVKEIKNPKSEGISSRNSSISMNSLESENLTEIKLQNNGDEIKLTN